jgi:hypothetical protein
MSQCGWVTATKASAEMFQAETFTRQGAKGSQGCHQKVIAPRGLYLTELVEPCGALPRKCSFLYLFRGAIPLGKARAGLTGIKEASAVDSPRHGSDPKASIAQYEETKKTASESNEAETKRPLEASGFGPIIVPAISTFSNAECHGRSVHNENEAHRGRSRDSPRE